MSIHTSSSTNPRCTMFAVKTKKSVGDCSLAIFQPYHGKNKLIFNVMMMRSALYQTNMLSQCQLTETTVCGQTCHLNLTHYHDFKTSLCSFSLMLHAQWRSNKYQFYSLWFDPIGLEPMIYHTRGEHFNHNTTDHG